MRRRNELTEPRQRSRFDLSYDPEVFGQFSEGIARFLGTARFLVLQTTGIVVRLLVVGVATDRVGEAVGVALVRSDDPRHRLCCVGPHTVGVENPASLVGAVLLQLVHPYRSASDVVTGEAFNGLAVVALRHQGDLMDAIEDLTPEWINELHEKLNEQGLTDCAMTRADLMLFKPEGVADQAALNALKRAGWRAIRTTLGGYRGRLFLRGERENVTKRTFRHEV